LLGGILITVLISAVNIDDLLSRFHSINIGYLAIVFLLPHIAMLLSTVKWQLLLRALRIQVALKRLFGLYMVGTFFSNFLPTMVGGDVVRSYTLYRETGDGSGVTAAIFLERFLGLTALISFLPLVIFEERVSNAIPMLSLFVIGITATYALMLALTVSPVFEYLGEFKPKLNIVKKVWNFAGKTHSNIRRFGRFKSPLLKSYVISLAFYLVTVATTWTAAKSLGVGVDYLYLLAIVPLVLLAAIAPISLNGLGITEAGYVIFLQIFGVGLEDALAIALLLRFRLVITALIGGLIFLWYRSQPGRMVMPDQENTDAKLSPRSEQPVD